MNIEEEVYRLRLVVKHLIESVASLETWRAAVNAQLEGVAAAPDSDRRASVQSISEGGHVLTLDAVREAMKSEIGALQHNVHCARSREIQLREEYNALLVAMR